MSVCILWGSEAGPISSPPKSTCRRPMRAGSWPSALAGPGRSLQAWCVVQALLGEAMPYCSDASDEVTWLHSQGADTGRSSGSGSFSFSGVYFSVQLSRVSNWNHLNVPPVLHKPLFRCVSPLTDFLPLLIADAYRMCPTCQALGQDQCPTLQAHSLQGIPRKQDAGSRYHWRCPKARITVLGWKLMRTESGVGRDRGLPTAEESTSSLPQKRRQGFMVNVRSHCCY